MIDLPPRPIRTQRLLLRPFRATDAAALLPVLEANRDHLSPWIPRRIWEPVPIPALEARLTGFASQFASNHEWRFAILSPDESALLGEVDLFTRNAGGRVPFHDADRCEIGYWLRADEAGKGLATEAATAMLALARALPSLKHVEIRCDVGNGPSAAVPKRLGFTLAGVEGEPPDRLEVWTLPLERPA